MLAAPDTIEVGEKPSVFEIGEIKAIELTGLTLPLAPDNAAGTLHALVFFRSFCFEDSDGEPEQLEIRCAAPVSDGGGEQMVMFDAPLRPSHDRALSQRLVEINLIWTPSTGAAPLRLTGRPEPILAN